MIEQINEVVNLDATINFLKASESYLLHGFPKKMFLLLNNNL